MIITRLTGGLGNQMFQYAAARRLAYARQVELKIDKSAYNTYKLHQYNLSVFKIIENYANKQEIESIAGPQGIILSKLLNKILHSLKPFTKPSVIIESHFHFNKNIADLQDNVYLVGYWQSYKYFQDVQNIIRKEFTFVKHPNKKNSGLISAIQQHHSISLHVRRGNYVKNATTYKLHGICSLLYYQQAVDLIIKRVKKPFFFIFSDDPKWCKENFKFRYPTIYATHNLEKQDYEDMRLMSCCQHNIIANSSFSWWGAWLNQNPSKIVIAPKKWFCDKSIDTKDLIPRSWIRI